MKENFGTGFKFEAILKRGGIILEKRFETVETTEEKLVNLLSQFIESLNRLKKILEEIDGK